MVLTMMFVALSVIVVCSILLARAHATRMHTHTHTHTHTNTHTGINMHTLGAQNAFGEDIHTRGSPLPTSHLHSIYEQGVISRCRRLGLELTYSNVRATSATQSLGNKTMNARAVTYRQALRRGLIKGAFASPQIITHFIVT